MRRKVGGYLGLNGARFALILVALHACLVGCAECESIVEFDLLDEQGKGLEPCFTVGNLTNQFAGNTRQVTQALWCSGHRCAYSFEVFPPRRLPQDERFMVLAIGADGVPYLGEQVFEVPVIEDEEDTCLQLDGGSLQLQPLSQFESYQKYFGIKTEGRAP